MIIMLLTYVYAYIVMKSISLKQLNLSLTKLGSTYLKGINSNGLKTELVAL